MSILITILFSILTGLSMPFQEENHHELIVELTGLRSTEGKILASIYDDPKTFPKLRGMKEQKILSEIPGEKMVIRFHHLTPGDYAIAIMHDENGDEKMNFNLLGFPKEGYCFSNNVKPKYRRPSFGEAKVRVENGSEHIHIRMKY
jgi:uncharacterized protein (DUF2141 family)